jgi:deoxycytidine triphosphate deaminase
LLLLSDTEIERLAAEGRLILPFDPDLLSGCAYDLRVGSELRSRNRQGRFDLARSPYVIGSGECVTVRTLEVIDLRDPFLLDGDIPAYMFAMILNKHTILATGLFHPATSVDPGFRERLALSLTNIGPIGYSISCGDRIAKVVFVPITTRVERIYGVTQRPTVREGDTAMALTIERPEQIDSDESLAKMYGKPIERLYARMKELEDTYELNFHRHAFERRSRRSLVFWTVLAGFLGLMGGVVGGFIPAIIEHFYGKTPLPASPTIDSARSPPASADRPSVDKGTAEDH